MKKYLLSIILVLMSLMPLTCFAGRAISLPFTESFTTNAYTADLIWVSNGASHTWESALGWTGGCAKFVMGTSGQPHAGLGQFTSIGVAQLNIRFLYKIPANYCNNFSSDPINKWIILISNLGTDHRCWLDQHGYAANSAEPGLCNGTVCDYVTSPRFNLANHANEWVCFEYQNDIVGNVQKLFITTSDGTYNENEQNSHTVTVGGTTWGTIDGIGFYYQAARVVATHYLIDELKIDDSYIGPPIGFVGTSAALTGTAISGGVLESEFRAGGQRIQIDLSGTSLVATFGDNNAITTVFIENMVSNRDEANGWNAELSSMIDHSGVTRLSDTSGEVVFTANGNYDITQTEIVTVTLPDTATESGTTITASPTFPVSVEASPAPPAGAITGVGMIWSAQGPECVHDKDGVEVVR